VCSRERSGKSSTAAQAPDSACVATRTKSANPALDFRLFEEARMRFVLLIILLLLVLGALPTWPYSGEWGYYPSGGLGLVLVIVLILVLIGRI
jgi:Protein of unknown function (DUF3309)